MQLPLEIINTILSYDPRFRIHNGTVSTRLDRTKYAKIMRLLFQKQAINQMYMQNEHGVWECYYANLGRKYRINYHLEYNNIPQNLVYTLEYMKNAQMSVTLDSLHVK